MLIPTASTPYEEHRDYVLGVLARRCGWLDPSDREALFHDSYAVFLQKQRDRQLDVDAMRPPQVRAYLTQTALNKAMDEGKRAGRRRSVSLDDEVLGIEPLDPRRHLDEELAARFDDARVREIVAELPQRQQVVIKLRFLFGRSPEEIQRYLGVTERVYRRELERASRRIIERYQLVREGAYCESQRSLILAYVTGVAGPNRRAKAREHLNSCPACRCWAAEVRTSMERVAAFVPVPAIGAPLVHGPLPRSAFAVRHLGERAAEVLAGAKGRLAPGLLRVNPSNVAALSAVRPATTVALVVGCLATGSTATYCMVHGLPAPIRSLLGAPDRTQPKHHRDKLPPPVRVYEATSAVFSHVKVPSTPPPVKLNTATTRASIIAARPPTRHPKRRTSTTGKGAGVYAVLAAADAQRVYRRTNPEFGLGSGGGSSGPAPKPAPAAPQDSSPSAGGSAGAGNAAPPAPSSPMPEFDP